MEAGASGNVKDCVGAGAAEAGWAEIAPEASIWRTARGDLATLEGAAAFVVAGETDSAVDVIATGATTNSAETAVARGGDLGEKTGERPGGLASERLEREPDNKRALEAKVHRETLRWRRDALALEKRYVQSVEDTFFAVWREFGAGVCTMKSPLDFEGAAYIFEVACEKTAPKQQKRHSLECRS